MFCDKKLNCAEAGRKVVVGASQRSSICFFPRSFLKKKKEEDKDNDEDDEAVHASSFLYMLLSSKNGQVRLEETICSLSCDIMICGIT